MHDYPALTGCCLNSLHSLFCVVKDTAKCWVLYFLVAASLMCGGALVMNQCKTGLCLFWGECYK